MGRVITLLAVVPWAWCVLVALLDRRHRLSLDDVEPLNDGPLVSVVMPARDEERGVRAAVASLAAQEYGPLEVIVVDDESSDATAAEAHAAGTDRVRVLAGRPVPPGWVGKSWACHQGFELARGKWLLFTDADVRHAPDTVRRVVAMAERRRVAGVTLLPLIETAGLVEQAIQPAAAVLIRSFVAPGPLVRSPRSPVAIAAGGFILVSRAAYEGVGGHEAMRNELVDDQMLAVRLKAAGAPLALAGSAGRCAFACTSAPGRRSAAGARTPRPAWAAPWRSRRSLRQRVSHHLLRRRLRSCADRASRAPSASRFSSLRGLPRTRCAPRPDAHGSSFRRVRRRSRSSRWSARSTGSAAGSSGAAAATGLM